jgi:hypothetical protein
MPYIDEKDRDELEPNPSREAMTPGELNFQVTCLVDGYLAGNLNYQAVNDAIGALECAKLELYRRIAAPYEDVKLAINGDVYTTKVRPSVIEKAAQK